VAARSTHGEWLGETAEPSPLTEYVHPRGNGEDVNSEFKHFETKVDYALRRPYRSQRGRGKVPEVKGGPSIPIIPDTTPNVPDVGRRCTRG
jgi:hypothetical protein